jgi:tRNA G18 (ribose-2'-O)-methylase SpoU
VYVAPPALLEAIVVFDLHRGLLAAGRRLLPTPAAEVVQRSRLLVLAEDLSNHDNVGGLFRTVAALAGAGAGVLLSPRCCDPLYRKALRVSMGHALTVPFATLHDWPGGLRDLARAGFRILALSPAGGGSVRRLDLQPDQHVAVLVGAEGAGLRAETLAALGSGVEPVAVPMRAGVDSLNVVVALGIALDRVVERTG